MTRSMKGALVVAAVVAAAVVGIRSQPLGPGDLAAQPPTTTVEVPVTAVPGRTAVPGPGVPSQPAVQVTTVPSPASPQHAPEQIMWALVASYLLQYLKKSKWFSFLTPESTGRLQAQCGFLVALLTAAGIHFSITGNVMDGSGAAFTITGLSFDALKDVGFQWASQQGWYDLIVHKRSNTPVAVVV